MANPVDDYALDLIFREARTRSVWRDVDVPEELVRRTYDLAKMGPTSANSCPARFLFVRSPDAKRRLAPHMSDGNRAKTMAAPWTVIFAYDLEFYELVPRLFPHNPAARDWFSSPKAAKVNGLRNGTLQAAYFMLAARSLGLDCGPMSGFDNAGVDQEFFENDQDRKNWRSNFICNLAFGSDEGLHPRGPRLAFDEACAVL